LKKNILVFGYINFSKLEIIYWNKLSKLLKDKGFELYVFGNNKIKESVDFNAFQFFERAEDEIEINYKKFNFDSYDISRYIERENVWYGNKNIEKKILGIKIKIVKYKKLLDELNPCVTILGNGEHANELIIKDILFNKKIPFFYFERGCLPNTWHFDFEGITANTKIAKTNINELKIQELSSENYNLYRLYYLSIKKTWWDQPKNETLSIRSKLNIPQEKKIILFLNQLDNDTSNFLYSPLYKNNIDAFNWLTNKISKHHNNYHVIVKKHPWYNDDNEQFLECLSKNNLEGSWVEDINIFDCIKQSDYVCSVNSTANFESLIYEKPVLQLGKSLLSNKNICYEVNSLNDDFIISEWLNKESLQERIVLFGKFMDFMINKELSFFINEKVDFNYLDHNMLFDLILKNVKYTFGYYPNEYIKLTASPKISIQNSNSLLNIKKTKIYKELKKIYFKLFS